MPDDFDVLKWKDLWDGATREAIEKRVSTVPDQAFFDADEKKGLEKVIKAVLPGIDESIPIVEILGQGLQAGAKKGVRSIDLPWKPDMYKRGLASLEKEAASAFGKSIPELTGEQLSALLEKISQNQVGGDIWEFPADLFFQEIAIDIASVYYAFPQSWNEIKFAGPAYPQGYYRLGCEEKMKFEPDLEGKDHG